MTNPSGHTFDKDYWETHWLPGTSAADAMAMQPPNPHLVREIAGLSPGTAIDAGCGAGTEAIWLAAQGWQVTGVDISGEALALAASRDETRSVDWVEADLSAWEPGTAYDLVTTHYAHPSMPQLDFFEHVARWVAPGGTLLIVGHLHDDDDHQHGHGHGHGRDEEEPPVETQVRAADISARLGAATWTIETATEQHRRVALPVGRERSLHDVVVRATRRR